MELHSSRLRTCWLIAAAVRMLRGACGTTAVAEWSLLANANTKSQVAAVTSLFGNALGDDEGFGKYMVLNLNSTIVTNPIGLTRCPLSQAVDHNAPLDGWTHQASVEMMSARTLGHVFPLRSRSVCRTLSSETNLQMPH
jgi:hypothetical protein